MTSRYQAVLDLNHRAMNEYLCQSVAQHLARLTRNVPSARREPNPGEVCSCGQPAVVVVYSLKWGEVPSCRS